MTDSAERDFDLDPAERLGSASSKMRRAVMYGVFFAALCLVLWSLTQGGDRNLWTSASGLALLRTT